MTSSLLSIGSSGINAAQAALDVTAQNIANASTDGYVRRSVTLESLSSAGVSTTSSDLSQYGVRVAGVTRNVNSYQQSEVLRTGADASRADTLVTGLTNVSNAVDQSNVYSSITSFMSAAQSLSANPTSTSLRANMVESAKTMAQSFNTASASLSSTVTGLQTEASDGVAQVNTLAKSLANLNLQIAADIDPASNSASLMDQRDSILQKLSTYGDVTTTTGANNMISVQMGGASGPVLVNGGTANTLSTTTAADGTISYSLGGGTLTLSGGALAGDQQVLKTAVNAQYTLDSIAGTITNTVNTAQANGNDLNGTTGVSMFSGTTAGTLSVVSSFTGSEIAAAGPTATAGSQDTSNLTALTTSLTSGTTNISSSANSLIYSLSSQVQSATTTQTALDSIYSNAKSTLASNAGVDLNTEAANLVQYQQAYQASGKVIQIASTLFNQLLQI